MDEVYKGSDSKCDVPWSESFGVENGCVTTNVFKNTQAKLSNPARFLHEEVGFLERPKFVGNTHSKCLGYLRKEISCPNHHCRRHNV
jgi:hypothetical protein